ncbi:hypothetical protein M9458_053701, partial [Cirrhinus mrigala]
SQVKVRAVVPESSQVTAELHKSSQATADLHKSVQATADLHEQSQVSAGRPESHHDSAGRPESSPVSQLFFQSQCDGPTTDVCAGCRHPSDINALKLSKPVHESAPEASFAHESAPVPLEAASPAAEPPKGGGVSLCTLSLSCHGYGGRHRTLCHICLSQGLRSINCLPTQFP